MPGRLPKHPSVRQRTNRKPTAALLRVLEPEEIEIPELPILFDEDGEVTLWSVRAQEYWEKIWSSPMAPEFHHQSDIEGLFRLVALVEQFWRKPTVALNGEIRLYEQMFGLNPMARRKLDWQIEITEAAQYDGEKRRRSTLEPSVPDEGDDEDPYAALA